MPTNEFNQAPVGSGLTIGNHPSPEVGNDLFEAFLACRTTLDDLSERTLALGHDLSRSVIAAHLTGRTAPSTATHNVLADAINARLGELSLPPSAPYKNALPPPENCRGGMPAEDPRAMSRSG